MMNRTKLAMILTGTMVTIGGLLLTLDPVKATPETVQSTSSESHSVWDGVYTDKQAQRGQALYTRKCSSCHGEKLTGKESEDAPAITGQEFETEWNGRTVSDLFRKILRKMPQDNPGTLSPQESADLVAFILQFNKFPAGKSELPAQNEALTGIRFDSKKK